MLGILISLGAAVFLTISNILEKQAVDTMQAISAHHPLRTFGQFARSRRWIMGFVSGIVGVFLAMIAFSLAPITVVQSVLGAGLCALVFATRVVIREPLGSRDYVGVVAVLVAIAFVALSTSSVGRLDRASSLAILAVSVLTTIIALAALVALRRLIPDVGVLFALVAGLLYGVAVLQTKGASELVNAFGALGAIPRVIASPYPYVFVLESLLGLIVFQSGLQQGRIAVVAPLTSIVASIYVVIIGTLIFGESLPNNRALAGLRISGFVLMLLGTWILATAPPGSAVVHDHETGDSVSEGVADDLR